MKFSKKILGLGVFVLLLLLVGGLYLSYLKQNSGAHIPPRAAEIASTALGVPVTIGRADISIKDGRAQFSDIAIANPDGFQEPLIMRIEGMSVRWDKVSKGLINITSLETYGAQMFFELNEEQLSNFYVLKKNIEDVMAEDRMAAYPLDVILSKGVINAPTLFPSVTYLERENAKPVQGEMYVSGNGQALEAGLAQDVLGKVMLDAIAHYEEDAARAGFYQGLSATAVQNMGVKEINRFTGQLKGEIGIVKEGLKGVLKSIQNNQAE